jgi:hypothetical protein
MGILLCDVTAQQVRFVRTVGSVCVILFLVVAFVLIDMFVGIGKPKPLKSAFADNLHYV